MRSDCEVEGSEEQKMEATDQYETNKQTDGNSKLQTGTGLQSSCCKEKGESYQN